MKMQFNNLSALAGLLAGSITITSALPLLPRQTNTTSPLLWNITNFSAQGAPYSISTSYEFTITDNTTTTWCIGLSSTVPEIGYLRMTNCTDPIYSFSFGSAPAEYDTPGYILQIWENDPQNEVCGARDTNCVYTGVKFFPASDAVTVTDPSGSGDPNGDFEALETASDFTIVIDGTHI